LAKITWRSRKSTQTFWNDLDTQSQV